MSFIAKTTAAILVASLLGSCSTKFVSSKTNGIAVSFEEFQKILQLKNITPLEGQNAFLAIMAMPGDTHPNIYRYDMSTKKFTKDYDHGQSISRITRDRVGKTIYVLIDNKGDENTGIYTYDPEKKAITPFFVKPGFKSFIVDSDKDGKSLFLGSNYENKSTYSIYKMDMASKKTERITDGKMNLMASFVSMSGAKVLAVRLLSNNENQVYVIDVKTKKITPIFKRKSSIFYPTFLSPDEKSVYGVSDYNKDRQACVEIKINKPNVLNYILSDDQKDISCGFAEWANIFWVGEASKGKATLKLYKKMFSEELPVPQLFNNQSVDFVSYDRVSRKILLQYSAANNPGSLYTLNTDDFKNEPVLNYNISSLKSEDLATTYDFEYNSFDGKAIHGIIHAKPEWVNSGKKYPLIVWPHGGPDSSETHNYRSVFQFLSLNGYVVFAPNYRGSTGYGKNFETLNDKDWGGGHIKDLIAGKNEVVKLPYVDKDNIFLLGGSFGGYSTLATVTTYPNEFKAAVGVVAIGNLFTFMKSIPPDEGWQSEFKREMGDPVKDKKLYEERSPFFHVKNIQIPLQIYQAENDVRTVKAEMDDFVAEMRKNNKTVDYTVLKDVGHGLETPLSRKQVYEGTVLFFNSYKKR